MIDQTQWLAEPGSAIGGQGHLVVLAVIGDLLAAPHLSADVHHLAGPAQGSVERHPVKALHHLRTRGADAEPESAVGHVVHARRRHRQQRGRPGVDRHHSGAQFDRRGLGGQIAELADRVIGVGLGDQRDVYADLLELDHLLGRFAKAAGVTEKGACPHDGVIHPTGW